MWCIWQNPSSLFQTQDNLFKSKNSTLRCLKSFLINANVTQCLVLHICIYNFVMIQWQISGWLNVSQERDYHSTTSTIYWGSPSSFYSTNHCVCTRQISWARKGLVDVKPNTAPKVPWSRWRGFNILPWGFVLGCRGSTWSAWSTTTTKWHLSGFLCMLRHVLPKSSLLNSRLSLNFANS